MDQASIQKTYTKLKNKHQHTKPIKKKIQDQASTHKIYQGLWTKHQHTQPIKD
jgi:hypothetical protein